MVDRKIIETVKSLQRDLSGWTEFNDSAVSTVDLKMNHQTISIKPCWLLQFVENQKHFSRWNEINSWYQQNFDPLKF